MDFIIASTKEKVARLEERVEDLSAADEVSESALSLVYEEPEGFVPSTSEAEMGQYFA